MKEIENGNHLHNNVRLLEPNIKHVCQYRPKSNWIKLNYDGAYKKTMFITECGGLFKDSSRNQMRGYAQKIDLSDTHIAYMWMMLNEIELDWQERMSNLVIESDSKVLIDMVSKRPGMITIS